MAEEMSEVKDIERVEIQPTTDPELVEAPESSQDAEGESEGEDEPDELGQRQKPTAEEKTEVKEVEGETPRERALRLEVTRLKREGRKERAQDFFDKKEPIQAKQEQAPEAKNVLSKYKPEEIQSLREVLPVIAEEMGFVKKDQIGAATYAEKAQDELDNFLEKHPEYLPEKDEDGMLWRAFKEEYQMYKQPTNPKDFRKIFERVHKDVFGIQAAGPLNKVNAAQEKAKVASYAGTSGPSATRNQKQSKLQGLRLDMLKGFSEEELSALSE